MSTTSKPWLLHMSEWNALKHAIINATMFAAKRHQTLDEYRNAMGSIVAEMRSAEQVMNSLPIAKDFQP